LAGSTLGSGSDWAEGDACSSSSGTAMSTSPVGCERIAGFVMARKYPRRLSARPGRAGGLRQPSSSVQTHESLSGKDRGMVQSKEIPASAVKWFGLTIDCADDPAAEEALRRFYLEALDGELVRGVSVRARGLLLIFQRVEGYQAPTWPTSDTPKQMHFELMVDDLGAGQSPTRGSGGLAR